ncbi:MAG: hypothetical protein WBD40_07850 [Tepidisphaeraceae bacterium]
MRWMCIALTTTAMALAFFGSELASAQEQIDVPRVNLMPDAPQPYRLKDWKAVAVAYDRFVFDPTIKGEHLPLLWWDDTKRNRPRRAFGLPSYVGGKNRDGNQEAINCIAAVLGATLAGIDKRAGEHDWVLMCEQFFNSGNGQNLILNGPRGGSGDSFWYELWPHVLFYGLVDRYPDTPGFESIMRTTADRWHDACVALGFPDRANTFDFTAFDFRRMQPVFNGKWKEPDAAAAIAWIQFMAWRKFGEQKYLDAADWCMRSLQSRERNPHYEVLCPLGAYLAARMNAELGRAYDVGKMLDWCFEPNSVRKGWGVIAERWGDQDCHGLVGSTTDRGGYAFAMNTFAAAGVLAPVARYDERYARAMGKWILNASNAARLFYADELPPNQQSCPDWTGDPQHVIAYEGLRKAWEGRSPFAIGDPTTYWKMPLDFGLYGSSHSGFFAALIAPTDVPMILRIDLLATDFFRDRAYPTFLYYNPHPTSRDVSIDLGEGMKDLFDSVEGRFVARECTGTTSIAIPANSVRVVVLAPAGGELKRDGSHVRLNGVVIDHTAGTRE